MIGVPLCRNLPLRSVVWTTSRSPVAVCYTAGMDDTSRPAATNPDTTYSLSIDEAAQLYARAGHPRTIRSIQRYCANHHLDSLKMATTLGDKYFINPESVARHISQIEELISLDQRTAHRDLSRPAASTVATQTQVNSGDGGRQSATVAPAMSPPDAPVIEPASRNDQEMAPDNRRQDAATAAPASRPDATSPSDTSRYVAQLEREVVRADEDRSFLRGQIKTKDEQIAALLERDKETNFLVRGLQQMLTPLLGGRRAEPRDGHQPDGFAS